MSALLLLLGILTGACALVVLADYFAPADALRGLFGSEPDYSPPADVAEWREQNWPKP